MQNLLIQSNMTSNEEVVNTIFLSTATTEYRDQKTFIRTKK